MEYELLWGDGPLGLTLRPDLGEDMPPVVGRITKSNSAAAAGKVAEGHMLVSINGVDTARKGYDHVVHMLQKVARPATLRFRVPRGYKPISRNLFPEHLPTNDIFLNSQTINHHSHSQRRSNSGPILEYQEASNNVRARKEQYTIVWTEGPLGMILRPDDEDCHVPCIRKITGKGVGTGMDKASIGDILVAVNGQETKSLGFRRTISLLKTIRKPAVLKFKCMSRRISLKRSSGENVCITTLNTVSKDYGVYDIVWREGELGLKLKPGPRDVPIISRLTGKGTASGLQNANVGDELMTVNGSFIEGEAYQDTLRMLKHSLKPAILRFRPSKDRRESMLSVVSVRSNPATAMEVENVRTRHVPMYDADRHTPTENEATVAPASPVAISVKPVPSKRKKRRIPLQVAKELVAAAQNSSLESAMFSGFLIHSVTDGTREAHILRVEAKKMILNEAEARRNGLPAKFALTRAEREAKVLQQALDKIKSQAKKYEEILKYQEREKILAPAIRDKSKEVIAGQEKVIAELADVISGLKRDSYTEQEIAPLLFADPELERQSLIEGLQGVLSIPFVVPQNKYCAECGVTETECKLDLDDDGQHYCTDCWAKYMAGPIHVLANLEMEEKILQAQEIAVAQAPKINENLIDAKELEETSARLEAEQKLREITEMRRSRSCSPIRSETLSEADKSLRDLRGLEELSQALKEEENRARSEGNLVLAERLRAQCARAMSDFSGDNRSSSGINAELENDAPGQGSIAMEEPSPILETTESESAPLSDRGESESAPVLGMGESEPSQLSDRGESESAYEADERISEEENDVVREMEQSNFALARQLEEAHNVVERARMSILMTGDDAGDDSENDLSTEQIQLFKKLTSQAEDRMSMVDRLHPPDTFDSDSDSNEGSDQEEDGVWI